MIGPAGLPDAILRRLNTEVVRILNEPATAELFRPFGNEPAPTSPEEFKRRLAADIAIWQTLADENPFRTHLSLAPTAGQQDARTAAGAEATFATATCNPGQMSKRVIRCPAVQPKDRPMSAMVRKRPFKASVRMVAKCQQATSLDKLVRTDQKR